MDTKKFEYLETIRETIEMGDYEELDEYVEDIRERVKNDPDFRELFEEIKSRNYGDVISLIEEFIYQDMRQDFADMDRHEILSRFNGADHDAEPALNGELEIPDDISFEEFHEEDYSSVSNQDDDL